MATRLPGNANPPSGETLGCDIGGMIVIHRMLRRLFTDAPRLMREVVDGNTERSKVIGDHVTAIARVLHQHLRLISPLRRSCASPVEAIQALCYEGVTDWRGSNVWWHK